MKSIRSFITELRYTVLTLIGYICCIFPVSEKTILFSSYYGRSYSCNPKYICEYIKNHYPEYRLVWVQRHEGQMDAHKGIICVNYSSLKRLYYQAIAKYHIVNSIPSVLTPKREGQVYIETWHAGGAYKTVGLSQPHQEESYHKRRNKAVSYLDYFISSSQKFTETNIEEGYHYTGRVLNCGMPRNDLFFDQEKYQDIRNRTRDTLKLGDQYAILFAPTYRGLVNRPVPVESRPEFDEIVEELRKQTGREVRLLTRVHYFDTSQYNFHDKAIDVNSYEDMQELLCAADLLITDYSSSMWDFALTGKPCLIYAPDIDEYVKNRGLYTPVETWPGIVCKNMTDIVEAIRLLDKTDFADIYRRHFKYMVSYESGQATETIVKIIREQS